MHPETGQCFGYMAMQTCNVTVLLQVFRNKEHGHQAAGSSGKFAWPFASSSLPLPSLILPFFSPPAVVSNWCRCLQDYGNSDHRTGICPSRLKVYALFPDNRLRHVHFTAGLCVL
jgi:hypothetical protein